MTSYTAAWLLAGERSAATERLGQLLARRVDVPAPQRDALRQRLADTTDGLLQTDLGELIMDGWRRHERLAEAARVSLAHPDASELVQLPRMTISTTLRPSIDIVVDGATVGALAFELTLAVRLDGLLARVVRGRLVELHLRQCSAVADLTCDGVPVAHGTAPLDLGAVLQLAAGIPLTPTPPGQPIPSQH